MCVCVVVSVRAFVHIFAFVSVRASVSIRVIVFVRACVSVVNVSCCCCKCGVLFAFVHECGRSYVCSCVLAFLVRACLFVSLCARALACVRERFHACVCACVRACAQFFGSTHDVCTFIFRKKSISCRGGKRCGESDVLIGG